MPGGNVVQIEQGLLPAHRPHPNPRKAAEGFRLRQLAITQSQDDVVRESSLSTWTATATGSSGNNTTDGQDVAHDQRRPLNERPPYCPR